MTREKNNDEVRIPSSCHVEVSMLTQGAKRRCKELQPRKLGLLKHDVAEEVFFVFTPLSKSGQIPQLSAE